MARFRYLGAEPGKNDSWMKPGPSVTPPVSRYHRTSFRTEQADFFFPRGFCEAVGLRM